jgi:competence protein ComEA
MMSEKERLLVDINTADLKMLTQLPGVGEALARRIQEERPFAKSEDLLRVPGLGKVTLARLAPFLRFDTALEGARDEGEERLEAFTECAGEPRERSAETIEGEAAPRPKIAPKIVGQGEIFRGGPTWIVAATAVVSVIVSVLLSLGILAGINRTLRFGQGSVVRQLTSDLATMQADLDSVSLRIEAIDRRLQAVEGISGRVKTIEGEFTSLQEEVAQSLSQMEEVRALADDLAQEVETLSKRVVRFDAFLVGLQELLADPSLIGENEQLP